MFEYRASQPRPRVLLQESAYCCVIGPFAFILISIFKFHAKIYSKRSFNRGISLSWVPRNLYFHRVRSLRRYLSFYIAFINVVMRL